MNLQGNWVDLVILVILIYFVFDSWKTGIFVILADFFGFLLSLIIALRGYSFAAQILQDSFSLSHSVSNALGFFLVAGVSEVVLGFLFASLIRKIPYKYWKSRWNSLLGVLPALGQAVIIISFMLTLVVGLPVKPTIKRDVTESKIGGYLVQKTAVFEARLREVFGGLAEDALTYLTIKPGSSETVAVTCKSEFSTTDEVSESGMLRLVNEERKKVGAPALTLRRELVPVARFHANDMCKRQYFSHYSPEGEDVGDRLSKANIDYSLAGENLAFAPTLQTAHTGLMNSPGHRRNILDPEFRRVGIGVIDNGIYGKMFVQIFSD